MTERRTPGRRPGENRRPPSGQAGPRARARPAQAGTERSASGRSEGPRRRPRLTGRAAILLLVVVALGVSFASSMRAYLEQRDQINELNAEISRTEDDIDQLQKEKARWDDPAYVERQARQRFGYVMPGEKAYTVLDEDGEPLDAADQLSDADEVPEPKPEAWWETSWESIKDAGNPQRTKNREPADLIKAPQE